MQETSVLPKWGSFGKLIGSLNRVEILKRARRAQDKFENTGQPLEQGACDIITTTAILASGYFLIGQRGNPTCELFLGGTTR